ncbi:MAG: ATP synthase F1 subunit epsilon [Sphingobacteriales bacterium]|jgi:F-type H+-transporting ATPase subunit epsilon|nr:MAG: ATP synthase F1 subunit epsilon [Sphingobacteriales bacterium]
MQLIILTPEQEVYNGEADSVQLPGTDGQFEILNKHAAMVASLSKGKLNIRNSKEKVSYNISGGIVEVLNNKVSVLTEGIIE